MIKNEEYIYFDRLDLFLIVIIIIGFTTVFNMLLIMYFEKKESTIQIESSSDINEELDIISVCSNRNLVNTSYCAVNEISKFYNYTIRNDTNKSFEDIKQNGGDCYDYSMLYLNLMKELNYSAKSYIIPKNETVSHMNVIAYDNTGYCLLDLNNEPECRRYL